MMRSVLKTCGMACLGLMMFCAPVMADEYMSVARDGINLRSGPNTSSNALFELPKGYPLKILSHEKQWVKVSDYEGDKGYIMENLLSKTPFVIVKVKECMVRQNPDPKAPVLGNVSKDVIFQKAEVKGSWFKVVHPKLTGWVYKSQVWPN